MLDLRPRVDPIADVLRFGSAVSLVRVGAAAKDRELADQGAAAALRLLPAGPDPRLTDVVFRWLGGWLAGQRRYDDAERVLRLHLASFAGGPLERGEQHAAALLELGTVLHLTKRSADALELLQDANGIVGLLPDSELRARVPEWLGFLLVQLGRVAEAQPFVEQALAAARARGHVGEIQSATISLAQIHDERGDHATAAALLWPVLDELTAAGVRNPPQGARVVGLLLDLQQHTADEAARAAASERLRAAAKVLLSPEHKLAKRLEQRTTR
jgi:tetratricopeptide (TPR) repeat protein